MIESRVLAEKHLKCLLKLSEADCMVDAIAFNVDAEILKQQLSTVEVIYHLQVNEFRGQRAAQLLIVHFVSAG